MANRSRGVPRQLAEADQASTTRLKVLARLSPVFHHELVGAIAPISINLQLGKSLLQQERPDLARLSHVMEQADGAITTARKRFTSLIAWLSGSASNLGKTRARSLEEIVTEAVNYMRLEFALRQVSIEQDVGADAVGAIECDLLCFLVAAMLATIDDQPDLSLLRIKATNVETGVQISIEWACSGLGGVDMPADAHHIDWSDVLALGRHQGFDVQFDAGRRRLHCVVPLH